MKIKSKAILLVLSALLLVAASVFGTLAYLTDTSEVAKNTFTVGKVDITLDEAKSNEYGVANTTADRVTGNEYKLIPGHEYSKDPTIHVASDSEDCWLFVKVENGISDIEAEDNNIAAQMETNGWGAVDGADGVYAYQYVVSANGNVNVFSTFTLSGEADVSNYADAEITITAYAIQADGFTTAAAAWNAAPAEWNN